MPGTGTSRLGVVPDSEPLNGVVLQDHPALLLLPVRRPQSVFARLAWGTTRFDGRNGAMHRLRGGSLEPRDRRAPASRRVPPLRRRAAPGAAPPRPPLRIAAEGRAPRRAPDHAELRL